MALQGLERSAPATTPAPDGDRRLAELTDGLDPTELTDALHELQWLAIEDPVRFQDWVTDTLKDPSRVDAACLYHPDLAVEVLAACLAIRGTVNDQLQHWRSIPWSDHCRQAWPMYRDARRKWEEEAAANGIRDEMPMPKNIPPPLASELRERHNVERRMRGATAFRRHIDSLRAEIETRLQWIYPDAVGGSTLRALARRDTIGRHRKFYLSRLRYYRDRARQS